MADLRLRLEEAVEADFDALVEHCTRSVEVVAYFLAMLELARWGMIAVAQEDRDAPIRIRYDEGAARTMETMLGGDA
ncbi:MAG: hypothetical protein EHM57_06245 [Actinobacteria bacterium]|nr:MAG: hypothetical protein EHM57_06245 [Actinomycetota bacterium]